MSIGEVIILDSYKANVTFVMVTHVRICITGEKA